MEAPEAAALISGMFLVTGAIIAGIFAIARYRPSSVTKASRRLEDNPAGGVAVGDWRDMIKDDVENVINDTLKGELASIRSELVGIRSILADISKSLNQMNGSMAQVLRDK